MESAIENLPLPTDTLVSLTFYLVFGLYVLFTAILYYHWNEYSVEPTITKTTYIFYFVSTIPLVIILGVTALII